MKGRSGGTQIGISKQIVVIDTGESGLLELVNPKIVSRSEEEEVDFEGCLSFPGLYGEVSRAQRVTVAAQDRNGEHYEIEAEGLLARALQHEIDHLNGILFIDHAPRTFTAEELAATEKTALARRRECMGDAAGVYGRQISPCQSATGSAAGRCGGRLHSTGSPPGSRADAAAATGEGSGGRLRLPVFSRPAYGTRRH